jgi:hypothetical protein
VFHPNISAAITRIANPATRRSVHKVNRNSLECERIGTGDASVQPGPEATPSLGELSALLKLQDITRTKKIQCLGLSTGYNYMPDQS